MLFPPWNLKWPINSPLCISTTLLFSTCFWLFSYLILYLFIGIDFCLGVHKRELLCHLYLSLVSSPVLLPEIVIPIYPVRVISHLKYTLSPDTLNLIYILSSLLLTVSLFSQTPKPLLVHHLLPILQVCLTPCLFWTFSAVPLPTLSYLT